MNSSKKIASHTVHTATDGQCTYNTVRVEGPLGGMKMNRLRELRIKAGMSQKELGRKIDRNGNTICKYEKGLREPKLNTWKILANTLHVTPQYLVGWTDDPRA